MLYAEDVSSDGVFFFQAEDGIRDLVRSRGLGDVYKRQTYDRLLPNAVLSSGGFLGVPSAVRPKLTVNVSTLSLIHI